MKTTDFKKISTLNRICGITTFIFAGIYGAIRTYLILALSSISMLTSSIEEMFGGWISLDAGDEYSLMAWGILLLTLFGLAIRIAAGCCLQQERNCNRKIFLVTAILCFVIAVGSLLEIFVLIGKSGFKMFLWMFCYFLYMLWNILVGVLLLLKWNMKNVSYVGGGSNQSGNSEQFSGASYGWEQPKAEIEGMFGEFQGRRCRLGVGEVCRIGRDSGCDIKLSHPSVSRIHCAVKFLPNGTFEVTDYSYNGTYYENIALPNGKAVNVQPGGKLVAGSTDNVFCLKARKVPMDYQIPMR